MSLRLMSLARRVRLSICLIAASLCAIFFTACSDSSSSVTITVGPEGGIVISEDGRLTLSIPAGALSSPADIKIRSLSQAELEFVPVTDGEPEDFDLADLPAEDTVLPGMQSGYELEPDGLVFNTPVTFTWAFPASAFGGGDFLSSGAPAPFITLESSDGTVELPGDYVVSVDASDANSAALVSGSIGHFSKLTNNKGFVRVDLDYQQRQQAKVNFNVVATGLVTEGVVRRFRPGGRVISDSFFFTEIDFTRPIAAARSPLSRIGVTGDRISLLSNRGVTVGNPASVKLADITFVCDSAGNASFDVSVPFKADTVSATVGARGETTTFGGNQVVAARRGTFEGSVTFSMAPVNCVSAVATPTSTPEPTATPSVTTNPTSTPTVVEESSEETSVGGGSPTVEPTVTPTAAPTATPDNSSSNSGNSGDSASGCFGLKEGGYTSSDDGCELGSGLSLNTTSEGNIVLSPFGSNGNTTFISAGSNARSFRNDLTLFEIGGHSCRLSCTPPNKFIVSCSNPFGGSCSQTFTAQ